MRPESGFWIPPNWSKIGKLVITSEFADMTSSSNFFEFNLFFLSSLVTIIYDNFPLYGIDQKSGNPKYPRLSFSQYLWTGVS